MTVATEAVTQALAQAAPAEGAEAAAVPAQEEQLSPKFAQLARKERELRQRYQKIKAQEEAFVTKENEYKNNYIPKSQLTKENFLNLAAEAGLSNEQIIDMVLNGPKQSDPTITALEKKLEALEAKQTQAQKNAEEQQTKQYQQAVQQIRNETKVLVDGDERFDTIKETDSYEAVVTLIEETYKSDGIIMKVDEAAKQVEEYLVSEALKMAKLKKVQAGLLPAAPAATQQGPLKQQQQQQTRTLTNAATTMPTKPMSPRERRERAIAAFKGELQQ